MTETLQDIRADSDILTIAQSIERYLNENWERVFHETQQEMNDRYEEIGDGVYGIYGTELFRAVHAQFKLVGLRSMPRLPIGNFATSREWGEEDDRQRWFWSKITRADGAAVGTIAIAYHHDHVNIRIPRPPGVIALKETGKAAVVAALSRISPDFGNALEARVEYAEYYQQGEG